MQNSMCAKYFYKKIFSQEWCVCVRNSMRAKYFFMYTNVCNMYIVMYMYGCEILSLPLSRTTHVGFGAKAYAGVLKVEPLHKFSKVSVCVCVYVYLYVYVYVYVYVYACMCMCMCMNSQKSNPQKVSATACRYVKAR